MLIVYGATVLLAHEPEAAARTKGSAARRVRGRAAFTFRPEISRLL
jgi:hypothetical protein